MARPPAADRSPRLSLISTERAEPSMRRTLALLTWTCVAAPCGGPDEPTEAEGAGWGDEATADEVATAESELRSSFDFRIKRGKHDGDPGGPRSLKLNTRVDRSLRFEV